jgi:hypothetical protein
VDGAVDVDLDAAVVGFTVVEVRVTDDAGVIGGAGVTGDVGDTGVFGRDRPAINSD